MSNAKDTIELIDGIFDLVDATDASLKDDGKITVTDAPKFFGFVMKLPAAVGGIQNVPRELSDLDDETREEVVSYFAKRFDLDNDTLELHIEDALRTGYAFAVSLGKLATRKAA